MSEKDYLNPCYILSNWTDPTVKFPFYTKIKEGKKIFLEHKFKKIHAPLLVAIDNDNVSLVRACLARYRLTPNHKYVIPQCETLKTDCFYLQPLLHRAISAGSVDVFEEFLKQVPVDYVSYDNYPIATTGIISKWLYNLSVVTNLANVLGNLVNRTIAMINKYFDGTIENKNVNEEVDEDLKKVVLETEANVTAKMDELRVCDALDELWTLFRRSNKYIDETEPWNLIKDEAKKDRLETVLYNLVESIRIGATLLQSFLPETSDKIFAQLQLDKELLTQENAKVFNVITGAHKVTDKPEALFARIDFDKKLKELEEKQAANKPAETAEEKKGKDMITIDDFDKVEMKIGEILKCEKVEGSDKLLKSQVKIGDETRQIVSGIHKWYEPADMVGKKVLVVTNLKPAKLKGELSEGMILAAEDAEGNVKVIECDIDNGSEVR